MNCPFCNDPIRFQKVKDSKRYEWFSCGNCGCKRRKKKEKLEDLLPVHKSAIDLSAY